MKRDKIKAQIARLQAEKRDVLAKHDAELQALEANVRDAKRVLQILASFTPATAPESRVSKEAAFQEKIPQAAAPMRPSERLRFVAGLARDLAAKQPPDDLAVFGPWVRAELPRLFKCADGESLSEKDERVIDAQTRLLHLAVAWARSGFNHFMPSEGLAAGLALTDASSAAPPPLPFDALAITPPVGLVPFPWGAEARWTEAIIVAKIVEDGAPVVRIACGREGQWIWRTLSVERWERGADPATAAEATPEAWLAPEDCAALDAAERLARNLFLWLEATDAVRKERPAPTPRRIAEKREASGEVWPVQWEFGREVKIGPELRRAAQEQALGRTKHAADGWRLRSRFIVRGHWRLQACGPHRSERRVKWIAAFWKGPAGAAAWSHLYKPSEPTTEGDKPEPEPVFSAVR